MYVKLYQFNFVGEGDYLYIQYYSYRAENVWLRHLPLSRIPPPIFLILLTQLDRSMRCLKNYPLTTCKFRIGTPYNKS